MKNISLFTLLLTILLVGCKKTENQPNFDDVKWILGQWKSNSDGGILTENWKQKNDSLYEGFSFFVKASDTLYAEKMHLSFKEGKWLIQSLIKGESNLEPIPFYEKSKKENFVEFENLAHNYPQTFSYGRNGNKLAIKIKGFQFGKPTDESYQLDLIKE